MKKSPSKTDHGFLELKLLLRHRLLAPLSPRTAVDFYAGEGKITAALAPRFSALHAVEKNPRKWALLFRRLQNLQPPAAPPYPFRAWCLDNHEFVRSILPLLSDINFLDFDAYGVPYPLLQEVFRVWQPKEFTAIAVTDGGRLHLLRGGRLCLKDYRPSLIEGAYSPPVSRSSDFLRVPALSPEEYELLVRSFWKELAAKHGFSLLDLVGAWRRGRRVFYYGLWIQPARDCLA